MKKIVIMTLCTAKLADAAVVLDTVTVTPPDDRGGIQTITTGFEDGASASWDFGLIDPTLFFIQNVTVGIGFSYFAMSLGDRLDGSTAATLDPIVTNLVPFPDEEFVVFESPPSDDENFVPNFYLGIYLETGQGFDEGTYGWVELANEGSFNEQGTLTVVSSATAFDSGGIIVGTTTAIPEPSGALLLGIASLLSLRRRRQ